MPEQFRLVCLANSSKYNGRCIAGKDLMNRDWIRPVSANEHGEISRLQMLSDGVEPTLLDIVEVPITRAVPKNHQVENYLIDGSRKWKIDGAMEVSELREFCDDVRILWRNGESSNSGIEDRVPIDEASKLRSSLLLIRPEHLRIVVVTSYYGSLRVRARFVHNRTEYDLAVTDVRVDDIYRKRGLGEYDACEFEVYLCVSLGESFNEYCYKLVAGVIGI